MEVSLLLDSQDQLLSRSLRLNQIILLEIFSWPPRNQFLIYIDYLKQKGVPVDELLVNKPKTEQEIYEDNLLGRKNDDLNWFINLDNPIRPDYRKPKLEPGDPETNYYKWSYIGRGHTLSNEQFDFLMGK